jgi:uncharacterized protein
MNAEELHDWMLARDPKDWDLNYIERKINEGIDINFPIEEESLISLASLGNRLDIVKFFVGAGANVNPLVEDGESALGSAARLGFQEIFDYLAPLTTPKERRLATIELPMGIRSRAIELKQLDNFTTKEGRFYSNFINNLLSSNEDINTIRENGCTLLWTAAHNGHLEALRTLINANANISIRNQTDGWSPLMVAALTNQAWSYGTLEAWGENSSRQVDVVRILIEAGANVNDIDNEGNNLLSLVRQENDVEIIQILENSGAIEI